jgi:hypothetical protein
MRIPMEELQKLRRDKTLCFSRNDLLSSQTIFSCLDKPTDGAS